MNNNGNSIFREKSIGRISSPEDLNDYVRVANPGVWLILTAIVVLLVGFICWGVFGTMETTIDVVCISENGTTVCYIREADRTRVSEEMEVYLADGTERVITEIGTESKAASEVLTEYAMHLADIKDGEWVRPASLSEGLPEGSWSAKVTVESIQPISFILN